MKIILENEKIIIEICPECKEKHEYNISKDKIYLCNKYDIPIFSIKNKINC